MTARGALTLAAEVLLGFLALACFAALAFGRGPVSDEGLLQAFRLTAPLAVLELWVLSRRAVPINRLILGANLWLAVGGLAAYTHQWWWLRACQQLGEASLFLVMGLVGLVSTMATPAGFVGELGPARAVRRASLGLLAGVGLALAAAVIWRGQVGAAAVIPVMALSWGQRGLRHWVRRQRAAA